MNCGNRDKWFILLNKYKPETHFHQTTFLSNFKVCIPIKKNVNNNQNNNINNISITQIL